MDEQTELLKYIYQEDLYIIDAPEVEKKPSKPMENPVESNTSDAPVVSEPKPTVYFGENNKEILIMVNDPTSEFLNAKDLDFLMKIIEAGLKFSKKDIALVNLSKFSEDQVIKEIPHKYLISFGAESALSADKPLNQVIELHGKKTLFSYNLGEISMDVEKKKALWKVLQSMFNI